MFGMQSKVSSKDEVYSDIGLPQETRKISFQLTPQGSRKRKKNEAQSQQKEGNNKGQSENK